jgi:hypothetical protein
MPKLKELEANYNTALVAYWIAATAAAADATVATTAAADAAARAGVAAYAALTAYQKELENDKT